MKLRIKLSDGTVEEREGEAVSASLGRISVAKDYYIVTLLSGSLVLGPYPTKLLVIKAVRKLGEKKPLKFGYLKHEDMWKHAGSKVKFLSILNSINMEIS